MPDTFVVESSEEIGIPFRREYSRFKLQLTGTGYLAGSFPDGITTVDGAPVAATVRALLRSVDPALDGAVVAETKSAPDGTWRIDGLPVGLRYDVIGRKAGHNDVIMANVTPAVD